MIPIAKPFFGKEEEEAVKEVLESGILAAGPKTRAFEKNFSDYIKVEQAIAVANGTIALDVALKVSSPAKLSKATEHWMPIGKTVIVMGGDAKGVQLTEFLTKRGREVTLVCEEDDMKYGEGLPRLNNTNNKNVFFIGYSVKVIGSPQYVSSTQDGYRKKTPPMGGVIHLSYSPLLNSDLQ